MTSQTGAALAPPSSATSADVLLSFRSSRAPARRYIADFRLIVASMHADVIPASYVRGFCIVKHKEHIKDMDAFKKTKDAFYWSQVRRR